MSEPRKQYRYRAQVPDLLDVDENGLVHMWVEAGRLVMFAPSEEVCEGEAIVWDCLGSDEETLASKTTRSLRDVFCRPCNCIAIMSFEDWDALLAAIESGELVPRVVQ